MTTEQRNKLAAYLLNLAADKFSNHSCNDLVLTEVFADKEEAKQISEEIDRWSGDPDEREPSIYTMDWLAMRFIADALSPEVKE